VSSEQADPVTPGRSALRGAGVVVTGAGSGIGAALAARFVAEGARVVVNDLDAARAAAVASQLGDAAAAVPGDAASGDGVADLIARAHDVVGDVDVYCANAGVAVAGSEQAPDAVWELGWQVNVMAHVRAARLLVPGWLRRGHGTWISTVSAAGLLTMTGAAPYAASKHAAQAFAEWLAVTYGDRGVQVHALCPQGVRTPLLAASGEVGELVLGPTAIEPAAVADALFEAMAERRFLVLPHPEVASFVRARAADTDAWLAAMRRVQAKVDALPSRVAGG
jgi:NAD(P)-dependent dehydrogenase (short-subunit alcohol dehydrogenase family)